MHSGSLVLIVDDDAASAAAIAQLVSVLEHRAEVAATPRRAIERALDPDVELACIDLSMRGMSGYYVFSRVRFRERARRLAGVPMIAVGGRDALEERARSLSIGFVAQLAKPVRVEILQAVMARGHELHAQLIRNRPSKNHFAILERVQSNVNGGGACPITNRLARGRRLAFQGSDLLYRTLLASCGGAPDDAIACCAQLTSIAHGIGASYLASLASEIMAAIDGSAEQLERCIVLVKAELDRVVFTLQEP
jgi:CheY-like chemotaxis protein